MSILNAPCFLIFSIFTALSLLSENFLSICKSAVTPTPSPAPVAADSWALGHTWGPAVTEPWSYHRNPWNHLFQVNVLMSFVLPLALTAFLNGVTVSHLAALCSQVPSPPTAGSSAPSRLELMSKERKTLPLGDQAALVRRKDSRRIRGLRRSIQVLS